MKKLPKTGWSLFAYFVTIFLLRIKETQTTSVCYEMGWLCNQALVISAIGCALGRPILVGTAIGLAALDQTVFVYPESVIDARSVMK